MRRCRPEALTRLGERDRARLADLDRDVVAADGGRLKLEWRTLRSRPPGGPHDFVVRRSGALIGFTGIYAFGGGIELAGAVHPAHRRGGVGSALLASALTACRARGAERVLLVVPRSTVAGSAFARRHGATFEHSEHALELAADPRTGSDDPQLELRAVDDTDAPDVARLLAEAFGHPHFARGPVPRHTTVVRRGGTVVGTLRIERDGRDAGIYGFAVDPVLQGRGIGRAVLSRVCGDLRAQGVERIALEVAVDNDRALALYTSIGFVPRVTEDYWSLPTAGTD